MDATNEFKKKIKEFKIYKSLKERQYNRKNADLNIQLEKNILNQTLP